MTSDDQRRMKRRVTHYVKDETGIPSTYKLCDGIIGIATSVTKVHLWGSFNHWSCIHRWCVKCNCSEAASPTHGCLLMAYATKAGYQVSNVNHSLLDYFNS